MDDFGSSKLPPDDDMDKPIPFDDEDSQTPSVSHSPLNLGDRGSGDILKIETTGQPTKATQETVSSDRITGAKTFFTKLHTGAISFLDEQITSWLKDNPQVVIKRTNTVTGEVQGKKTEPNIIVTIWY